METKLWRLYVALTTDKIYDRVYIGYVAAENNEEAVKKMNVWAKNQDPLAYVLDRKYDERCYKDVIPSRKRIKKIQFRVCRLFDIQPLKDVDIIIT